MIRYISTIFLAVAIILLIVYISLTIIMDIPVDIVSISLDVLVMMAGLIPISVLAFFMGCCQPGTRDRLIVRIAMNFLLILFIFLIVHTFDYSPDDSFPAGDLTAQGIDLTIYLDKVYFVLMLLPLISIADAVAEFLHGIDD